MNHFDASSKILVTGAPGVGKTTLIVRVAERLGDLRPVGFYTREIRTRGARAGFEICTLDGRARDVIAHVDIRSPYRVGRYGVDTAALDRFLAELDLGGDSERPVLVDEIGKMECFSGRFRMLTRELLGSDRAVLATVALRGTGLIAEVKSHPKVRLVGVTVASREGLVDELVEEVQRIGRNRNE